MKMFCCSKGRPEELYSGSIRIDELVHRSDSDAVKVSAVSIIGRSPREDQHDNKTDNKTIKTYGPHARCFNNNNTHRV